MNVILDASLLGMGFYHPRARTGVSRVAEHLLEGLRHNPEVDLWLAAPTHLAETMRYASVALGDPVPRFINRAGEQSLARFENSLLQPFPPTHTVSKVIREVSYRLRKGLGKEQSPLAVDIIPGPAIYHAPFFPIPAAIQAVPAIQNVQTLHDLIPIRHPEWFTAGEQTVQQILATITPDTWVTTVSQATKDDFCTHTGFDPNRVVPIRLAASPRLFHRSVSEAQQQAVRQRFGIGEAPFLLSLATLEPRKNIAHLIRTFGELAAGTDLPANMRLVLVGTKGWLFDELLAEANRNAALKSRLIFTGFVPDEELAPLYTAATAFVYPSLDEGFGLPPLEAMQCGLPVITSTVPAIAEVVGEAAIRVSPTDSDALSQAILSVTRSSTMQADLTQKGIARASLFSWDKFTAEHVALYKRIIAYH